MNDETAQMLDVMCQGILELEGLISWGSNYTFLGRVCLGEQEVEVIYKPRKGERPLWDFASGTLCLRERAAYLVSEALGWNVVPPTVLRDGPHGWGSVQLFVQHDPERHYFTFEGQFQDQLKRIVLFDLVINNADRKGGHVLVDEHQQLWSIDHGICFHSDYKLRSVIWEFAGQPIPESLLEDLRSLQHKVKDRSSEIGIKLDELLNPREIEAIERRLGKLLRDESFPRPGPGRHYPWPPV
ncbi:MAG TPA: SCO1664 family protein [Candidatus Binatia bacterium]|nr:SCO1664 family protein [Candidatus Binatia bacterium]